MPEQKKSLIEDLSKAIFFWACKITRNFMPGVYRRLVYFGLSDNAFDVKNKTYPNLSRKLFDRVFETPFGIAPGFDPNFKYNNKLLGNGFSFHELGTLTMTKNDARQKLHFFPKSEAVVVETSTYRNIGIPAMKKILLENRQSVFFNGVNISSTSQCEANAEKGFLGNLENDILTAVQQIAPFCDFICLNISNPYMPISNLSHMPDQLGRLLQKMKEQIQKSASIKPPKLFVRIPYQISKENIALLSEVFLKNQIDAVEVAGFYQSKNNIHALTSSNYVGYVCGRPISEMNISLIKAFYEHLHGIIPIIASGGCLDAKGAFERILAGADLIELHSAIILNGPDIANTICEELSEIIKEAGFSSIAEAVGKGEASKKEYRPVLAPAIPE